ncbi:MULTISPECIES: hypothetical protein [unclassified Haladaptatus]|uniref:hypothetical protein n=1 Tax=unclassified Haladaptatus TaxID=2622732 RepID=UPI00209C2570|nr:MULTISPECIES: hypothetical protein [unclassified Haladaptatus]MCO8244063.1 hypothetical protein [Haladaptatus sp. AB643]MCO8255869.1 hypothetical protein [Haladaptatus sp. AB618]
MSEYRDRITSLAERARDDRESFDPPADPPDEELAVAYLRNGVGDVVSVYIDGRTAELARFDADEMATMERALNEWVALYARCYGYDIETEFTVREVAEMVLKTYDLRDTVQLLTQIPDPKAERVRRGENGIGAAKADRA